jgi:hypothetical protein
MALPFAAVPTAADAERVFKEWARGGMLGARRPAQSTLRRAPR